MGTSQEKEHLDEILGRAIITLYHKIGGGRENYGKRIGTIDMTRLEYGKMGIAYTPSQELSKEGYQKGTIATINLKDKTYTTTWNGNSEDNTTLPFIIMHDTDLIMPLIGLRKKE